jgi:hypothetical protein
LYFGGGFAADYRECDVGVPLLQGWKDLVAEVLGGIHVGDVVHGPEEHDVVVAGVFGSHREGCEVYAVGNHLDVGGWGEGLDLALVVGGGDDQVGELLAVAAFVALEEGEIDAIARGFLSRTCFELLEEGGVDGAVDIDDRSDKGAIFGADVDFVDAMFAGDDVELAGADGAIDPVLEFERMAGADAGGGAVEEEVGEALEFVAEYGGAIEYDQLIDVGFEVCDVLGRHLGVAEGGEGDAVVLLEVADSIKIFMGSLGVWT